MIKQKHFLSSFFFFFRSELLVLQIKLFILHTQWDEYLWTRNFIPVTFSGYRQALFMTTSYSSQLRPFLPLTADFTQAAWRSLEEKSASVQTFPKFLPSKPVPPVTQPSELWDHGLTGHVLVHSGCCENALTLGAEVTGLYVPWFWKRDIQDGGASIFIKLVVFLVHRWHLCCVLMRGKGQGLCEGSVIMALIPSWSPTSHPVTSQRKWGLDLVG